MLKSYYRILKLLRKLFFFTHELVFLKLFIYFHFKKIIGVIINIKTCSIEFNKSNDIQVKYLHRNKM